MGHDRSGMPRLNLGLIAGGTSPTTSPDVGAHSDDVVSNSKPHHAAQGIDAKLDGADTDMQSTTSTDAAGGGPPHSMPWHSHTHATPWPETWASADSTSPDASRTESLNDAAEMQSPAWDVAHESGLPD